MSGRECRSVLPPPSVRPAVVPSSYGHAVTVTAPIRHLCPFVDEVDEGHLTVAWVTSGATVEAHSLASYLAAWASIRISHEDLVGLIAQDLSTLAGIDVVKVEARFVTAGMTFDVAS